MIEDLVFRNRSYRRFQESYKIDEHTLRDLIKLARLTPSGANLQPLKYLLSNEPVKNDKIFPNLAWAGYLKNWPGPIEGERPSAYVIILGDKAITKNFGCDHGIAAQTILLGATEKGLGGCMIGSINRENLRKALHIPAEYEILLVLALGKPVEEVVIQPVVPGGEIKYWRDEKGVHHVPKRALKEIIVEF